MANLLLKIILCPSVIASVEKWKRGNLKEDILEQNVRSMLNKGGGFIYLDLTKTS